MKSHLLLVLWALSLTTTAAYADTIKNYYYEGTYIFFEQPPSTFTGRITVDTTTGVVTDASDAFGGPLAGPPEVFIDSGFLEVLLEYANFHRWVNLQLPVTTLIGYDGSYLCTEARPCPGGSVSFVGLGLVDENFITGSISAVPEPSTLALLATGIFTLAGTIRRRFHP